MRADCIRLMIAAARLPLRSDPAKSQFDLPSAHGLIWFSTALSLANQISVDAVPQCHAGNGYIGAQAFLDNLGLERSGIRGSLTHGVP